MTGRYSPFLLLAAIVTVVARTTDTDGNVTASSDYGLVRLASPDRIFLAMGKRVEATFQVLLHCRAPDTRVTVTVQPHDKAVVSILGNSTYVFLCNSSTTSAARYNTDTTMASSSDVHGNMENIPPFTNENITALDLTETKSYYAEDGVEDYNMTVSFKLTIQGKLLGITKIVFNTYQNELFQVTDVVTEDVSMTGVSESSVEVTVVRVIRGVDLVFQNFIFVFIVFVQVGFGCKLDLQVVRECLRKPVAPAIGLACQYVVMPLVGFAVATLVPSQDGAMSLGIFLCGICPGGGASNIYSYLLNGDVSLSITMTFISTLASFGMLPLWMYTLGRRFVADSWSVSIPFTGMLSTVAAVSIPLLVGIFIQYKLQRVAKVYLKVLKPASVIAIIVMMTIGIISNMYIFKLFSPMQFLAGCLLPYFGYILGGLAAVIFRQKWTRVKTIALETGMQNVGVAMMLLISSFPAPLRDLAAVAPVASAMMTPLPVLLITLPYLIYNKWFRTAEDDEDKAEAAEKNGDVADPTKEKMLATALQPV